MDTNLPVQVSADIAQRHGKIPRSAPAASDYDTDLLPVYLLRFDRVQTKRAYKNDLCQLFESEFITLQMAKTLDFVYLNTYIEKLQQAGLKASSIQRKISAIRGFYSWLMALGFLDRNPADRQVIRRVDRNSKSQHAITVLSKEQAKALVEATQFSGKAAVRDRALLQVTLHCTLRRSEVAAMDAEHIRSLPPYWILDLPQTKGGTGEYVKVPAHVVEELNTMKEHYGIGKGPIWRSLSRNDSRGNRLSPAAIYEVVRRTARRAGLGVTIGAHTLRHTGCTLAIESGATLQQVQTHARHKRLETTMTYVHQRDKLKDSAADYIKL